MKCGLNRVKIGGVRWEVNEFCSFTFYSAFAFMKQLTKITTIIFNDPTDVLIMVNCAVIKDNNTQWPRKWIELWSLDQMANS